MADFIRTSKVTKSEAYILNYIEDKRMVNVSAFGEKELAIAMKLVKKKLITLTKDKLTFIWKP